MAPLRTAGMEHRPQCSGACQKYSVSNQLGKGRHMSGRAQCLVCDVWVDAKGARLKNGSIATVGSVGWYCRCCRNKLRTIPRTIRYKSRLGVRSRIDTGSESEGSHSIDLSFFNRLRAELLQRLAAVLPESRDDLDGSGDGQLPDDVIQDLRHEFGDMGKLLDLAYDIDPPNKISLVIEFERVKSHMDMVPTKSEFEKTSPLSIGSYDSEFGSWENFLDKLGHDPWYRGSTIDVSGQHEKPHASPGGRSQKPTHHDNQGVHDDVATLRENIRGILEYDPEALRIFEIMEADIGDVDPAILRRLADEVESD